MVFIYNRLIPWTNEEYINFKRELNVIGVKIREDRTLHHIHPKWTRERVRVKFAQNEEEYAKRIKAVKMIFCKYYCEFTKII